MAMPGSTGCSLGVDERGTEEAVRPFFGESPGIGEVDRDGWVADGDRGSIWVTNPGLVCSSLNRLE